MGPQMTIAELWKGAVWMYRAPKILDFTPCLSKAHQKLPIGSHVAHGPLIADP